MGGNEDGRGMGERLAMDPNDNRILYFGSRHDGLMRSSDCGETWQTVANFPLKRRGLPRQGEPTHGGLSFVVFDPSSGTRGSPTQTIFVGSADPGQEHLFRSNDGGATWESVRGQPDSKLLPAKAEIDDSGNLYVTYSNGIGPNGVSDGAVMKLNTKTNEWTDITPDKRPNRPRGGYMGLSLDRSHPGTLAVATMNRWDPIDTIWRSTDGGATWRDIYSAGTERDVSLSPFLKWGKEDSKLGWWMAALAIDPFDPDHVAYATGATVYASRDFSNVSTSEKTHWTVWGEGIEQTAVITLLSPSEGAHLLSGFGDLGGFVHEDLDRSPPQGMFDHPMFGNTNTLDFAELKPSVIVRSGQPHEGEAPLAWSDDSGKSWHAITLPKLNEPATQPGGRRRWRATPALIVSADGSTMMLMTRTPMISRDSGETWSAVNGLPPGARPVADRVNPGKFYAIDFDNGVFYTSTDDGATFAKSESSGLPQNIKPDQPTWHEAAWPLIATPGKSGDLWFLSSSGLFHSTDAGRSFARIDGGVTINALSFGKAPPGKDYPALFAIGTLGDLKAIWRSDDAGQSWIRINDDQHQYGTRFRCISGDPRIFGRVYVGTDGRGVLCADFRP